MEFLTEIDQSRMLVILDKLKFFRNFSTYEKKRVVALHTSFFSCKMGEYIIREGNTDTSFYILIMGRASVTKKGKSTPLAQLSAGDFFGEVSFLTDTPRTTNVIAEERTVVMRVDQALMEGLSPDIREKVKDRIIERLLERLNEMNHTILSLSNFARF